MKEIGLTMGYKAIVDDEDYIRISRSKWRADYRTALYVRAKRCIYVGCVYRPIYMHHEVLNISFGQLTDTEVDHINRNPLDNRKENLRIVTHQDNLLNTAVHDNRIGVSYSIYKGRWIAYLDLPKQKRRHLGTAKTKAEALALVEKARNNG